MRVGKAKAASKASKDSDADGGMITEAGKPKQDS